MSSSDNVENHQLNTVVVASNHDVGRCFVMLQTLTDGHGINTDKTAGREGCFVSTFQ